VFFTLSCAGGAEELMNNFSIITPLLFSSLPFSVLADTPLELSPLTVTATRSPYDSRLVSNTTITRQDIQRRQIQSVEEALRGITGVNIANKGGLGKETSVFLRGTSAKHVLVLIDGIRAGSATLGSTAWQHLPISEIESIEVVRGPKSSLYGADAIGGIIHIHTRNAANATSIINPNLSVGGGTYGHYKVAAGVSGKHDKTWYNLNFSHENAEGFNAKEDSEIDRDGYTNYASTARIGSKLTDWLTLEGHVLYSAGSTDYDATDFFDDNFNAVERFNNKTDFTQLIYGGQATIQALDFWRINLNGGESRDEATNYLDINDSSRIDTQKVSFSAINHFNLAPEHLFSLGYDFQEESVSSSNDYDINSRNNHAVLMQYQGEFLQNQVALAYRSDHNQQFGQNSTWNASWGYAFNNGILVSASYGTGFKAPTFNDLYWPGSGNPDLRPEKSESYEIGVNGKHKHWQWGLSGYLTYINDLINWAPNASGQWLPTNISSARIMGLEANIAGEVYGFDIQANFTALKPQNMDAANFGKILRNRAQQVLRIDVDRKWGLASLGTTLNYEGRRFNNASNTSQLDGFVTWDLRAEYQFYPSVIAQVAVKNILNTQYQTAASYNSAGTTVFFNLRYTPSL